MNSPRPPHTVIGFQPCDDNVLVRLAPAENSSPADTVRWGEVIAVGPGRRTHEGMIVSLNVAAGDCVALRPRSAVNLDLDGQSFAIVGGADVLGVLVPGAEAEPPQPAARVTVGPGTPEPVAWARSDVADEESLETDVAPDILDRETPTSEDLH